MGSFVVAEGESGTEILLEDNVLAGLDVIDNGSINRFLCFHSFLGHFLLLKGINQG